MHPTELIKIENKFNRMKSAQSNRVKYKHMDIDQYVQSVQSTNSFHDTKINYTHKREMSDLIKNALKSNKIKFLRFKNMPTKINKSFVQTTYSEAVSLNAIKFRDDLVDKNNWEEF